MKDVLTGNYDNCKVGNRISISINVPNDYTGLTMSSLIPSVELIREYTNHIDSISEQENIYLYSKKYYLEVLKKLDPKKVLKSLHELPILICNDKEEYYTRHLVAFWFEHFLGIKTGEIRINPKRETLTRLKRPEELKLVLEKIIKEDYNMNGYNSIQAAYLYNQAQEIEAQAVEEAYEMSLKNN